MRASITFGCTLSGLTCMTSSGTSGSMLQGCNTSTFILTPHLNITQVSWKVQLFILSIIYSRINYFQFGGRMFQDGDLKT